MNASIKNYFIEAFLIFLSVVLATMVTDWNDKRKEKQETRIYLENLLKEMKSNQRLIQRTIPYHERIHQVSDSLFKSMSKNEMQTTLTNYGGLQKIPSWRGIGVYPLDNSVYQSGVMSGKVNHLPLSLLSNIARVESFQAEYIRFSGLLTEKLLSFSAETKMLEIVSLLSVLGGDVLNLDKELDKAYSQIVTDIENYLKQ